VPDYMRPLDKSCNTNYLNILDNKFEVVRKKSIETKQTVTMISKINGWLTLDP